MVEEIFGTSGEEQKPKTEEQKPEKEILDTLNSLKSSMDTITNKVTELETKIPEEQVEEEEEAEHFKPKTWDEIPQKAEEIARQVVEEQEEARRMEAEEAKKSEQAQQQQIDTFINNQVASLESSGVIPKIENPNDENDKGRSARRELFGLAARVGTMDLSRAHEVLDILHKSGYTYDAKADNFKGAFVKSETTPPGVNSPVAGSKSSFSQSEKPSYDQIASAGGNLDKLLSMATGE